MIITQQKMEEAVRKACDADACPDHMGEVWCAARNYMFGCRKCLANFSTIVILGLAPKKRKSKK